jgi:murein DD-endopeptidase MepM/ murein hydrolase activator NlpD
MRRLSLLLLVLVSAATHYAFASDACKASPASVPQGDVVRLTCNTEVPSAKMGEKTVPLFKQADGTWLGLMPVPVNDKPGSSQIVFLSASQQQEQTIPISILDAHFATQNVNLAPGIAALRNTPEEVELLAAFRKNVSDTRYWQDQFIEPVPGCMVSPFGVKRFRNHKPTGDFHGGVDLRAATGTPVRAASDGTVKIARLITAMGNIVAIDHGQGVETIYMHMSKLAAEPGAQVKQGDVVGYAGMTGRANGPHLHWSVYVNGIQVNPGQWVGLTPCPK